MKGRQHLSKSSCNIQPATIHHVSFAIGAKSAVIGKFHAQGVHWQDISERLARLETLLLNFLDKSVSHDDPRPPREKRQRVTGPNLAASVRQENSRPWEFLLEDGHRVQYVSNSNLLEPLEDEARVKSPAVPLSNADASASSPRTNLNLNLGISTQVPSIYADITQFYPDATLALRLWTVYVNNVDPVLKILHIPTTQSAMVATIADTKSASPTMIALSFAIYFAAVTTLTDKEISELSSNDRQTLLYQYKTGLNQAVIKADYLNKPDLQTLQALVIYITCLRIHDISRSVWVLVGIVIRLAQSIGIHRDGADLKLTPFEAELRIRLWWHICLLDSRSPEDHGYALTVDILNQDIRAPLNVDDNQLFPCMQSLPVESTSWTENTFSLVKIEAVRLLRPVLETGEQNADTILADIEAKRKLMSSHGKWIHEKFLSKAIPSIPLHKSACVHYESAWAKMEFMLQLREEMYLWGQKKQPSDWRRDPVKSAFHIACRTLEVSCSLISGDMSDRFMWLFHTHTQWYALAYVLRCLNVYGQSSEMTSVWALVDKSFKAISTFRNPSSDLPAPGSSEGGSNWRCVLSLRQQALRLRNDHQGTLNDEETASSMGCSSTMNGEMTNHFVPKGQSSQGTEASVEPHIPQNSRQAAASVNLDASAEMMNLPSSKAVLPSESELEKYDPASLFTSTQAPELFALPEWNDFINGNLDFLNTS
ncbi:transcriptional regulator family: Fungal Specific TF [Paecilomyces variotii]|nr:transcriptional regulator family: Fungal Specific TF [Paecilomyces variotii]